MIQFAHCYPTMTFYTFLISNIRYFFFFPFVAAATGTAATEDFVPNGAAAAGDSVATGNDAGATTGFAATGAVTMAGSGSGCVETPDQEPCGNI